MKYLIPIAVMTSLPLLVPVSAAGGTADSKVMPSVTPENMAQSFASAPAVGTSGIGIRGKKRQDSSNEAGGLVT